MFWNKHNLNSELAEVGREIERGLMVWESVLGNHWQKEGHAYHEKVEKTTQRILKNETLSNVVRSAEAGKLLNMAEGYEKKMESMAEHYKDFTSKKLTEFSEKVEQLPKDDTYTKAKDWLKLTLELFKIRERQIIAIKSHIGTDKLMALLTLKNDGAANPNLTKEETDIFAHQCATYGTILKTDSEKTNKIEPERSKLSSTLFGKMDDYLKGGSFSKLIDYINA